MEDKSLVEMITKEPDWLTMQKKISEITDKILQTNECTLPDTCLP
jgi:hypothetical protein